MAQRALCSKRAAVAGVTRALGLECGGGGVTPANWSVGVARASGPVHGTAPLLDEPLQIAVSPGAGFHSAFWTSFFGRPYQEDCSRICIPCVDSVATYPAFSRECDATTARHTPFGTVQITSMTPIAGVPATLTTRESQWVPGLSVTWAHQSTFYTVSGYVVSNTGVWSIVSGVVAKVDSQSLNPDVQANLRTSMLTVVGTHESIESATHFAIDLAAWSTAQRPPGPRSNPPTEPEPGPDCEGYRACVDAVNQFRSERLESLDRLLSENVAEILESAEPEMEKDLAYSGGWMGLGGGAATGLALAVVCLKPPIAITLAAKSIISNAVGLGGAASPLGGLWAARSAATSTGRTQGSIA